MEIESLLMEMRRDQRDDHTSISKIITDGFKEVHESMKAHEQSDIRMFASIDKRVSVVESTRHAMIWLVGALIVAVLGGAADAYFNHHLIQQEDTSHAAELSHAIEAGVPRR